MRQHMRQDHPGPVGHRGAADRDRQSSRRPLCQLLRPPSNRVNQKLALASADDLSASLEIPVRISQGTLQLGDAIDQKTHLLMRQIGRIFRTVM
jgi:hypothetical protein